MRKPVAYLSSRMILPPSSIQISDSCPKGVLLYAGARNVVSLWNVNDSATAGLMKAFYQNLNRGLPKSEPPRRAKLALLGGNHPVWQHPHFWARRVPPDGQIWRANRTR